MTLKYKRTRSVLLAKTTELEETEICWCKISIIYEIFEKKIGVQDS